MGRPRKPTALKVLEGAQPCRINRHEPEPPRGAGPCPDFLDDVGRETWARITRQLDAMGVLTEADGEAVALYCSIYSQWIAARSILAAEGLTSISSTVTETSRGSTVRETLKPHPLLATVKECQAQMCRLLGQFGMTPASRSGLKVGGKPEEDPILAFLAGKTHAGPVQAKAGKAGKA